MVHNYYFVAVVYVVLCPVFTVLLMYVVGGIRISTLGIIKVQSIKGNVLPVICLHTVGDIQCIFVQFN